MKTLALLLLALLAAARLQGADEIYVWQRQWTPEVQTAVLRFAPRAHTFALLAGEIHFPRPAVAVKIPWGFLAAHNIPTAIVIRLSHASDTFAPGNVQPETDAINALLRATLAAATAAGASPPREIQLDFDCPQSKLPAYADLLAALRAPGQAWAITALPAWLGEPAWPALARAAGSFILQVHSLDLPKRPQTTIPLCDPAASLRWADRASAAGVSFRVALPTYRCLVLFRPDGKIADVLAEDDPAPGDPSAPGAASAALAESDPAAIAPLAAQLRAHPPANFTGLLWYRLPVATDRRNWPAPTLEAILDGRIPAPDLQPSAPEENGVRRILLTNTGDAPAPLPAVLTLTWDAAAPPPAAFDALGGYTTEGPAANQMQLTLPDPARLLRPPVPPGGAVTAGWIRTTTPVRVEVISDSDQ